MPKKLKYTYHQDMTIPVNLKEYIFVFGSNEAGLHGRGAALIAKELFNAEQFIGIGITGKSYAIPTKDRFIRTLPIRDIIKYIEQFKEYTHNRSDLKFWVTRVGCGLAKYKNHTIAPLFSGCNTNCCFPEQWRPFVEK